MFATEDELTLFRIPNRMSLQQAPTNQGTRQRHEGLMHFWSPFVTTAQAAELMQPKQGSFDHLAIDTQATAVRRVALCQERLNAQRSQPRAMRLGVIGPIALHALRSSLGSSASAVHCWNGLHQRLELRHIMRVRTRQDGRQRHAACVGDQMMFAARFAFGSDSHAELALARDQCFRPFEAHEGLQAIQAVQPSRRNAITPQLE